MKKIILCLLIAGLSTLTACDDKDAQNYARQLGEVLNSYQEQTNQKIKAEQDSYTELAEIYARASKINVTDTLETERVERSDRLADELLSSDRPPSGSDIRDRLRNYAAYDFDLSRKNLQQEADAKSLFLADIEGLEFDAQNIAALSQALKELAKAKSQYQRLKDYADFAKTTNEKLDELFCKDLADQLKTGEAQLATLNAKKDKDEITSLNRQIAAIKARQIAKPCGS